MAHDLADALALGGAQFLLQVLERLLQALAGALGRPDVLALAGEVRVELFEHAGSVLLDAAEVALEELVQERDVDVVARAGLAPAAVVRPADVGGL